MFANIYGAPGVAQLISMMKLEMTTTLALLGQSDTNKLNSTYVSNSCQGSVSSF
jgi:isopentenyl diphosphate isomerase/L-lactate dehydrogenase-like FMN-dependent dehydrogenase